MTFRKRNHQRDEIGAEYMSGRRRPLATLGPERDR